MAECGMIEPMPRVYPLTTVGLLTALLGWPAGPATSQPTATTAQEEPMAVTTDTPEYCLLLLDRVSERVRTTMIPIPRQVTDLTSEGQRMCANGQTRSGIMRLRSALMMIERKEVKTNR
jgi:hypothetical protein